MIDVKLTATEMLAAANIGARREIESQLSGRKERVQSKELWYTHIDGALGEYAVAKALGLYMDPGLKKFKEPDVGEWHVRTTKYPDGDLRVDPEETSGKFLLVTGRFDTYIIQGWVFAEDAHQEEWFGIKNKNFPDPMYWVPQNALIKRF